MNTFNAAKARQIADSFKVNFKPNPEWSPAQRMFYYILERVMATSNAGGGNLNINFAKIAHETGVYSEYEKGKNSIEKNVCINLTRKGFSIRVAECGYSIIW